MNTQAVTATEVVATRGSRPWIVAVVALVVSALALVVSLLVDGAAWSAPPAGIPDAGALVGWALPLLRLIGLLLGTLTTAGLLYASVLGPQGRDGVVSRGGRRGLVRAGWAAGAWAITSALLGVVTLSSVLALPLSETVSPAILSTYGWDLDASRIYFVVALLAAVIACGVVFTSSIAASFGWLLVALIAVGLPALTGHAAGLGDHALAVTSGVLHQIAATVWFAGVAALAGAAWRHDPSVGRTARRFSAIATVSVSVLALSGILSTVTRLDNASQLVTTWYGVIVLTKVGLFVALLVVAGVVRSRLLPHVESRPPALRRLLLLEVGMLAAALGLAVALARTAPPRATVELASLGEELLGYAYPPAPTVSTVVLGWHPDAFFLIVGIVAAGLYIAGVLRLRARGDRWPPGRTIAWLLGIAVMMWTTNAGINAYAPLDFGLHMMQHMTMSMLTPILLVLGGPFTLALRAIRPADEGGRGARELIVWLLHSPLAKFFTNPIVVLLLYTVGLYGLYYTPLFGQLMTTHLGHVLMSVHFILAGYLFHWVLIGVDPVPKPLPHWARLVLLLLAIVIHSFFALPIMSATQPLAAEWFSQVQPPWVSDLAERTRFGGGVAWGMGEIPALVVMVVIAVQWARADEKVSRRRDRQVARDGDAELDAYNAYLARLAASDEARKARGG